MGELVSCPLMIAAGVLVIPVMLFLLEVVSAITLSRPQSPTTLESGARLPLTVLVPAHNESGGLLSTISNIKSQLLEHDRLLVVADNCSDDTAAIARTAGAEVIERDDSVKRGKGYALDWGIRHLSSRPTEIVIVVDADCKLAEGAIDRLTATCASTGRPTQALYLMTAPAGSPVNHQVAEFSWRVKNWLRPLGLGRLNSPCQLMGTGMAFPWKVIASARLDCGQIVEDLKLGLDLTLAGHPPIFCPSARVTSEFASSAKGASTQRKRWEHGHLDMILRTAPGLLTTAIARRNRDLLLIALDLAIPPLSLLWILAVGAFVLSFLGAMAGWSFAALIVSTVNLLALMTAISLAWFACGRDVVPPSALLLMPSYVFRKLNLYRQFMLGKIDSQWTRTDRSK